MTKSVRRLTADKRERIQTLATILSEFLPLTSRSAETTTFMSIFAESRVANYLARQDIKRKAVQQGFEKLYQYHEKLPKLIIRKVVPAGIAYRIYQRRPVSREEINGLSRCLYGLEIDMREELQSVQLNTQLPRIVVPPKELKERLRKHDLDPSISAEPLQLFDNGHFNEAVRKAFEKYENEIRNISGLDASGRDLMSRAFADTKYINTTEIKPENTKDFNDGYKLLAMGSMAAIRNIFSHGDEIPRSPEECFETLLFLNWLFRYIKLKNGDGTS